MQRGWARECPSSFVVGDDMGTCTEKGLIASLAAFVVAIALVAPAAAFADDALGDVDAPQTPKVAAGDSAAPAAADVDTSGVTVSKDGDAAEMDGSSFAIGDFSRAQKGTNREIDGEYHGYSYLVGQGAGSSVQLIAGDDYVVCYVPAKLATDLDIDVSSQADQASLKALLVSLDAGQAAGSKALSSYGAWYFTTDAMFDKGAVRYLFDQVVGGKTYAFVIGVDGSDLTDSENPNYFKPMFADFGRIAKKGEVDIVEQTTGLAAAGEFLSNLDWSPLWVSLRTTGIAIVIIFVLGLLAAYFCLNVSQRWKNILDVIFTIPMVLPPTVCGFLLLYVCGRNTAFGQFWIDIGFPLIFSPVACVIAAVVVAFPLMYRNALGAFESLDPNMLDAARTLGWSNAKIFIRLMLPLSWSSIAAGAVLSFARALGEFGATLFLAGNYLGVTRTIPIAIYFEWMNGNDDVAWFWTAVIIAFSFVVILFINLWSSRTTKYRTREGN